MSDPCQKEEVFEILLYEVRETRKELQEVRGELQKSREDTKAEIEEIVRWKWMVMGGAAATSAIFSWLWGK
jgi:broad-specificity NMP kinase